MMHLPSVSKRLFYREVPNQPEEPASTIVLTSPRSFFVDVRLLKRPMSRPDGGLVPMLNSEFSGLQWAFAGTSESSLDDSGRRFSTWHHWVDSNSDDPPVDTGEMITQDNGNVLEKGNFVSPITGQREYYEELWEEVPTEKLAFGKDPHVCTVLRTEDQEKMSKGMIIRLGDYCQGILKKEGEVTVERWESHVNDVNSKQGKWHKTATVGTDEMPCDEVLGSEPPHEGQQINRAGMMWDVVEVATW